MKTLLRPSLLLLGTATALVGGGGMLAYAGWPTTTDSASFTVHAARIPRVPRPQVTLPLVTLPVVTLPGQPAATGAELPVVVPRIGWRGVELAGEPVHRYVVTRHAGRVTDVVCTVPATRAPSCLDLTAPPASVLTYTVAAAHGDFWVGPDSAPSVTVSTTGTPSASPSGVPLASELPGTPTVTPTTVVPSADATTTSPDAPPPDEIVTDLGSGEPLTSSAPPPDPGPTVDPLEAPPETADPSSAPAESLTPTGP